MDIIVYLMSLNLEIGYSTNSSWDKMTLLQELDCSLYLSFTDARLYFVIGWQGYKPTHQPREVDIWHPILIQQDSLILRLLCEDFHNILSREIWIIQCS